MQYLRWFSLSFLWRWFYFWVSVNLNLQPVTWTCYFLFKVKFQLLSVVCTTLIFWVDLTFFFFFKSHVTSWHHIIKLSQHFSFTSVVCRNELWWLVTTGDFCLLTDTQQEFGGAVWCLAFSVWCFLPYQGAIYEQVTEHLINNKYQVWPGIIKASLSS